MRRFQETTQDTMEKRSQLSEAKLEQVSKIITSAVSAV
jgi:hypothetical protein